MGRIVSLAEATTLAKSGDPQAQYALSSLLHQRGEFDDSIRWLRLAAAQGLVAAQVTLAKILMYGQQCGRDIQHAIELLRPLAPGQVQANLLLAEIHGFAALDGSNREIGLRYLFAAARMGEAGALRQLALLSACHHRWDLVRPLLAHATRLGDAVAGYALASCFAAGIGGPVEAGRALTVIVGEPARSQYLANSLAQSLRSQAVIAATEFPPVPNLDWPLVDAAIPELADDMQLPMAETLHSAPLIQKLSHGVHSLVLDALINIAAPLVSRSHIVDARTGDVRIDPMRNSSHVTLGPRHHDHVLEALERSISILTGTSMMHDEFPQILRYRVGEEFKPHVDYFNESGAGAYQSLALGGQRAQTVLIYLNDGYDGGATSFPALQLDVKAGRGDILHFRNLDADGRGNRESLHAGARVINGEKWLLSLWIRSSKYPLRCAW